MTFNDNFYEVVKSAINASDLDRCVKKFEAIREDQYYIRRVPDIPENIFHFADSTKKSFSCYCPSIFEEFLQSLKPLVQTVTGVKLYPTYSYGRIYYTGAELEPHIDRESCEYSVTVCISNDPEYGPWPIWFKDKNQKSISVSLEPGDLIIYKGMDLEHWREPYCGKKQIQAFLHYVDKDGEFEQFKYDLGTRLHVL